MLLEDEVLRTLTLDREMSTFDGICKWMRKEVRTSLDVELEKKASWTRVTMDNADCHLETIQEKNLPVEKINAYNHMAIYLRWCINPVGVSDYEFRSGQRWRGRLCL